jgi:hypothetical protein
MVTIFASGPNGLGFGTQYRSIRITASTTSTRATSLPSAWASWRDEDAPLSVLWSLGSVTLSA